MMDEAIREQLMKRERQKRRQASEIYHHKWPRGLRKKLVELDGGVERCFFCWSKQPGLHIAHIHFRDDNGKNESAYLGERTHDPKWLVLLCPSCHGKFDKADSRDNPFVRALTREMIERQNRIG